MLEDINLGQIDGATMWVAPRYEGRLTERERRRMIANAARNVLDILEHDAAGAPMCTDCTPESHDALTSFRGEFSDLLYLSLNFGFLPRDMPETVRAVGEKFGIADAEIERLVRELRTIVRRYLTQACVTDEEPDMFDTDGAPRFVRWRS